MLTSSRCYCPTSVYIKPYQPTNSDSYKFRLLQIPTSTNSDFRIHQTTMSYVSFRIYPTCAAFKSSNIQLRSLSSPTRSSAPELNLFLPPDSSMYGRYLPRLPQLQKPRDFKRTTAATAAKTSLRMDSQDRAAIGPTWRGLFGR